MVAEPHDSRISTVERSSSGLTARLGLSLGLFASDSRVHEVPVPDIEA
jgi:hypothetical protein